MGELFLITEHKCFRKVKLFLGKACAAFICTENGAHDKAHVMRFPDHMKDNLKPALMKF